MSHVYEDYVVDEKPRAYFVSEIWDEDSIRVRIEKSLIKSLELEEEPEMIAIVLGKIELIRIDSKCFDQKSGNRIIIDKRFQQKLKVLVEGGMSMEDILTEISEMKYHETKEYFLS